MPRIFGEIVRVPAGTTFQNRRELSASGVHRPLQAGISGASNDGADSIIVSGGYEDDEDYGEVIVYTGHGGNDPKTGRQVADQRLERGNAALVKSRLDGLPVRVTRGAAAGSEYAPRKGYRYDGLYYVEDSWQETGKSGCLIYRYRLVKDRASEQVNVVPEDQPAPRRSITTQRIIRNTVAASGVKSLYAHHCQVCNEQIVTPVGPYSEGAHIQPLGLPHNGPDVAENILCLCPNHHVLFDYGAFSVSDELKLIRIEGSLNVASEHRIGKRFLRYHRSLFGCGQT